MDSPNATDPTRPVKREPGDEETPDNAIVVKPEPSENTVSPASVPPLAPPQESSGSSYSSSTSPRAEIPTRSHTSHGRELLIKPDPATTISSQSIADIPQSEMKLKAEPDMDADANTIAGGDASMEVDPQPGFEETDYLQQLVHEQIPEVLETGVEIATKLLKQLKEPLEQAGTPDVELWLKSIKDLESRAKPPRTVVGVVGNTGAGKSSVINALLDEER